MLIKLSIRPINNFFAVTAKNKAADFFKASSFLSRRLIGNTILTVLLIEIFSMLNIFRNIRKP